MHCAVRGVVPPVPTFLREDGSLDGPAQARTVERLARPGVDGVLVLGTAGEGPVLPDRVRAPAIAATVAAAGGRLAVVAGCWGQTSEDALERIEEAAEHGASAALLLPPFYLPLSQRHLRGFVDEVVERSSLPVLLYHIPERTGHGFGLELLRELAEHPGVVGIKDSSKDLAFHHRLLAEVAGPSFAVFQGAAPLVFASARAGSPDSMCPVTALVPEWELALRAALRRGDLATAASIAQRIDDLARLFHLGDGPMPAVFKTIAALLGLGPDIPHAGFVRVEVAVVTELASRLRGLGLKVRQDRSTNGGPAREAS
jgi:dihydrodipicolinate synthase/N-acetylneuraminate lyase